MRSTSKLLSALVVLFIVFLSLAPAVPVLAAPSVLLAETDTGFHYEFEYDAPYLLLKYKTAAESGTLVLTGDNGRFAGDVRLIQPQPAKKVSVDIKTPHNAAVAKASLNLRGVEPATRKAEKDAVRKVTDLTLTPGVKSMSIRFTAPGHHQVNVSISCVMQKLHFALNETENSVFECVVPLDCVNARDLVTVTIQNQRNQDMAKASERTLFDAPDPGETAAEGPLSGVLICIDPGHQALEVHGGKVAQYPGSGKRVSGGDSTMAQGRVTLRKESVAVLEISYHLCRCLRELGAEVIMTRWSEEVSITNIERANYANEHNADYFLRIHLNNSSEGTNNGVYVYGPVHSPYAMEALPLETYRDTAQTIVNELVKNTNVRGGVVRMSDQFVGNNYAKMPAFLIECGFLSTPANDWILTTPDYQHRIAQGIANGMARIAQGDLDPFVFHK